MANMMRLSQAMNGGKCVGHPAYPLIVQLSVRANIFMWWHFFGLSYHATCFDAGLLLLEPGHVQL